MRNKECSKPNKERPFRYYMEHRPISLWKSIQMFWKTWKWSRYEIYMRPVKKGEIGYSKAPFEEVVITIRDQFQIEIPSVK